MEKTLDLANVPKELRLILELVSQSNEQKIIEQQEELCKDINWQLFVKLAIHHRLYPLLYSSIRLLDEQFVPAFVPQTLMQYYKRNAFQMLRLSAEMERVSTLFSKEKIRLLLLKGPALAHELYGDISLRTSGDLDVLIQIDELENVDKLLTESGYKKDDYIESVLNDWKWRHHHVTYFHREKQIKLEIHWRLNPGPAKEPEFNELWERRQRSNLSSRSIYLLGNEDLFLFLVSHGARHGWSRLRWLVDIHQFSNIELNGKKLDKLLIKYQCHQLGGQSLTLASELLNTTLSNELKHLSGNKHQLKLAQQAVFYLESMVNLHTYPVPEKVAQYHKRYLFSLMSLRQRFLFIISFLYPYYEDVETLPLPKRFHFLYFPLRPILWAWRKTRRHALT
ncbi:nucleotidyltransferase domain-containing protein [Virgibacillus flavescens]|uniref:nucleotidyltransferase domain-containing protein n=1 Tax=Virgibacillus flavescens TaxID=1611422 RepID=UPI003D332996